MKRQLRDIPELFDDPALQADLKVLIASIGGSVNRLFTQDRTRFKKNIDLTTAVKELGNVTKFASTLYLLLFKFGQDSARNTDNAR